ncbi:MAG: cyclic pyranopterin monophosphate synthase MoaC [Candidatus Omnitrophica bacterium]|nr:cyclic pyranopterin monophosphate synthase MoaC [Candidatus Omnitrophota bacterium]
MNDPKDLTHLTSEGDLHMVDVGDKSVTTRVARAEAVLQMKKETAEAIRARTLKKGDAFTVAKIAGINAAKETARLIPLCHTLPIEKVDVQIEEMDSAAEDARFRIESLVRCEGKTGVEMEALTAVSVAALTFYDMCKAIDREMEVVRIRLIEKRGGKSDFLAEPDSKS